MTPEHEQELTLLGGIIKAYNVRSYLEIGCRNGVSLSRIAKFLPTGARMVAVDLPGGPWGSKNSDTPLKQTVDKLNKYGLDAHLVLGNSRSAGIVAKVNALKPKDGFGLIYIDGDHTYEGVSADWQNYGRMGRIVAFDDIWNDGVKRYPDGSKFAFGVMNHWNEIKHDFRWVELAGNVKRTHGIGVLWQ